jgi:hypothetical protein
VFQEERKGKQNMENIALTLREVADKVNDEKDQNKRDQYLEVIETKVIPFLKEEAEAGRYTASLPIPGYNFVLMRDLLREMGFTADTFVYNKIHHLIVRW